MIELKLDVDKIVDGLSDLGKRQLPFALANALNRTAEEAAAAVRTRIFSRDFRIRSSQAASFLAAAAADPQGPNRATKNRLRVFLWVNEALGKNSRFSILPNLEEGGQRVGTRSLGSGRIPPSVAVPIRSSLGQGPIPRGLYPAALGLQERRAIEGGFYYAGRGKKSRRKRGGLGALHGSQRTFIVMRGGKDPLVVQRTGKGRRDTRALFVLKRSVPLPARHFFFPIAT